jgi:hypothetical protein
MPEEEVQAAPPPNDAPPTITSPAEWRRRARAAFILTLPNGFVLKVKRPDWAKLARLGVIDAQALISLAGASGVVQVHQLVPLMDAVLPYLVLEPPVTPAGEARDDALSVDDIDETTKMILFAWANGQRTMAREHEVE